MWLPKREPGWKERSFNCITEQDKDRTTEKKNSKCSGCGNLHKNSEENVSVVMYNTKEQETPEVAEEVAVPSTSSFETVVSSFIGFVVVGAGSVLIAKNLKKKNGI